MRLLVSLTTIPDRIGGIEKTIDSIARQTARPDSVYLTIPQVCRRQPKKTYEIPPRVREDPFVRVIATDYDYGSSMKLLGALQEEKDPDSIIITVDDDHEYDERFVETLLDFERVRPESALGFNGWMVDPLVEENRYVFIEEYADDPIRCDVLEGYRGVLYKKRFFDGSVFDYGGFPKEAHMVDDVWISAHLAKRGVERLVLPGVYSKEHELPRGLHKLLRFKRYNRKMAAEFRRRGYW
ncbi:MAG: hypothetical protein JXQ30_01600 [Spirochaetes bacterium]|nr:hypothetical protein [Spirochaetota bacterium]